MGLLTWLFGEKEESPPEQLVFGAELHCPRGSENSFLIVKDIGFEIGCLPGACVDDCEKFVNIEPFGECKWGDNCATIMELDNQWVNEEPQRVLSNGKEIITTKSTLMCRRGRCEIYPITSGRDGAGAKRKIAEWEVLQDLNDNYPGLLEILCDPYGSLYLSEGMYPMAVRFLEERLEKNGGEIEFTALFCEDDLEKQLMKAAFTHLLRGYDFTSPGTLLDSMRSQGFQKELDQEPGWNDTVLTQDMMEILKGEMEDVAERMKTDSFFRWQEENKKAMMTISDSAMYLALLIVAIESAKPTETSGEELKIKTDTVLEEGKVPEGGSNYEGQAYEGIRNPEVDFVNGKGNNTLAQHAAKHGYDSLEEYLKDATNFLGKPPTSTTQSFVSSEGTYFRYDTATNEFGIINQYGGISTYFKPDEGIAYWLEQIEKYAPK